MPFYKLSHSNSLFQFILNASTCILSFDGICFNFNVDIDIGNYFVCGDLTEGVGDITKHTTYKLELNIAATWSHVSINDNLVNRPGHMLV